MKKKLHIKINALNVRIFAHIKCDTHHIGELFMKICEPEHFLDQARKVANSEGKHSDIAIHLLFIASTERLSPPAGG